jgi:hypothetical protein
MEFSFSQKFESLIVSFDGSFRSCLLESSLVILTLGRTWYHHTSLSSAPLSQGLPILPDIFPRKGIMEPALPDVFLLPPSLIMPPNIQFRFVDEAIWRRVWFLTRSGFHAEFLEFQNYSRHRNHFDIDSKQTHSEEIQMIPMERFSDVMKTFCFDFWWKIWSDIWLVIIGLNFNLRVNENHFQSIHFICMNNDFVSHEKALPTDPDCLPLIRKGLIRHVM